MEAGAKTVVVAEDEILIRLLAADVLTDAGFDVIEVGNVEEALTILQFRPLEIHFLFHGYSHAWTNERSGAGASCEAELASRGVAYRIGTKQAASVCAAWR
jgi:hypothetical protein